MKRLAVSAAVAVVAAFAMLPAASAKPAAPVKPHATTVAVYGDAPYGAATVKSGDTITVDTPRPRSST